MSSIIRSFRQRSYYLRKRMFCLSTGLWALGTPKSEYSLGTPSTSDWDVNMSWSPPGRGHPCGKGMLSSRGPRHGSRSCVAESVSRGSRVSFRACSATAHIPILPFCVCNSAALGAPAQAARIKTAPTPCHNKGSMWPWLRVVVLLG